MLSDAQVPFLVGGSHALLNYTGIVRETKDFDLFLRRSDIDAALAALDEAGYDTEITFPHWLAKARSTATTSSTSSSTPATACARWTTSGSPTRSKRTSSACR